MSIFLYTKDTQEQNTELYNLIQKNFGNLGVNIDDFGYLYRSLNSKHTAWSNPFKVMASVYGLPNGFYDYSVKGLNKLGNFVKISSENCIAKYAYHPYLSLVYFFNENYYAFGSTDEIIAYIQQVYNNEGDDEEWYTENDEDYTNDYNGKQRISRFKRFGAYISRKYHVGRHSLIKSNLTEINSMKDQIEFGFEKISSDGEYSIETNIIIKKI